MTKMLISVRDADEALLAARCGAGFIDLKEPRAGALGGLTLQTIVSVLAALRRSGSTLPVSATIGDWPTAQRQAILERVQAVAACGVDIVKVGIERDAGATALLQALADCGAAVVPVFIADRGLDPAALQQACELGFAGVMVDSADKTAGSLFDMLGAAELQNFVAAARAAGVLAGLAGALRLHHVPALLALAPDFAGFRSAVCAGDRTAALDGGRLRALAQAMQPALAAV